MNKQPKRYNPREIEPKWQAVWAETAAFAAPKTPDILAKDKMYVLDMFPYPSGEGLHVGHVESYTASDIVARYNRRKGKQVLHPMGWDAFGLPAENYAIKTGIHPAKTTTKNIANFRRQLKALGFSYDWSREVNTTDPSYYKWTQLIFLQLFKAGLAYEAQVAINWCPSCKTGLANEEVVAGECERCGTQVGKKTLRQWLLRITKYAEPLLRELDDLDWPERIKTMQRNWIGRSEGAEVSFEVSAEGLRTGESLTVFTTRADTLFGCTYLALAPEHKLVLSIASQSQRAAVEKYISAASFKSDLERSTAKQKTGVFSGSFAINPLSGAKLPIWIADYVLANYGTGAIMAVPAHDERDYEFAKTHDLSIKLVIEPDAAGSPRPNALDAKPDQPNSVFTGEGRLVNSGEYDGTDSLSARKKIAQHLVKKKLGRAAVHYKLRDWVFSRQRYWGEPIPIIHCPEHGAVPVPEDQLPVELPQVEKFAPTGTGESPLAAIEEWVNTTCPQCGKPAQRETNTMPQWAGSSWYFLRFADPQNDEQAWSKEAIKTWLPVDFYIGGAEHAVLHLLYARFWVKALNDAGRLSFREPFLRLRNQGIILAEDGAKMSKSRGNVVNPDDVVKVHGADALRLFEMFLGPLEQEKAWSTQGIAGLDRFLDRVWRLQFSKMTKAAPTRELRMVMEKTTKQVTSDIENLRFNTAISALMQFSNALHGIESFPAQAYERLLLLLAPFAPHIAEEIWAKIGHESSIHKSAWPTFDAQVLETDTVIIAIQVNGKFRGQVEVARAADQKEIAAEALKLPAVVRALKDQEPSKQIFIPGKVLNLVV